MSDGGKAALCSGTGGQHHLQGRGKFTASLVPGAQSQQRARSCVSTGCAMGTWLVPRSAGLSPLPGTCLSPPSFLHSPIVPVPPFWLLSWHPWVLGAKGLPRVSRTWVPASRRLSEGVCLSGGVSHCASGISDGPSAHLSPAAGSFWHGVPVADAPTCTHRVCRVMSCFGQKEKGGEPSKAAACCLLCSLWLCRKSPVSIPLLSLAIDPLLPGAHPPKVQKLGLPLGTSISLMEGLHLNAWSPSLSPREGFPRVGSRG